MTKDNIVEFISRDEQTLMLYRAVFLPLAKRIHAGEIDPETIKRDELVAVLSAVAKLDKGDFEIYVDRTEQDFALVEHCVAEGSAKSGVVLFFTLLEGEVNTLIRIHLRVRGFAASVIADALRGTDFASKLDLLLPLVEVRVPERFRNAALQARAIRNVVVHDKGAPAELTSAGVRMSDGEVAEERAKSFFAVNPIKRLQRDLDGFMRAGMDANPALVRAGILFWKFYG